MSASPAPLGGRAVVNVFDGTRSAYSDTHPILITVADGNHKIVSGLSTPPPPHPLAVSPFSIVAATTIPSSPRHQASRTPVFFQ